MAKATADVMVKDFDVGSLFWIIYESLEVENFPAAVRWHQKTLLLLALKVKGA